MSDQKKLLTYFEEQAPIWKAKAACGIERHRKGDAALSVTDREGRPISNATVKVMQKNHAFRFGANLFMLEEFETAEKNEAYKRCFADLFNMATLPFYWNATEPQKGQLRYDKDSPKLYRRPAIDLCMEFCEKHGIEPREHALAYEHFFPEWLRGADVATVKCELERRCAEMAERYADKIPTIEVTNEMEWPKGVTSFYDEPDYIEFCFRLAEKYFPKNQLVINEHTGACWKEQCRATDKYSSYVEANLLRGARIDAVGMQYHLFYKPEALLERAVHYLNPERLTRHMDLYARFGKPLQVTEVTVPAYSWEPEDEEVQAKLIENLYTLWFSHPSVEQIIYWNLVDGYAHVADATPEKLRATMGNMSVGENYYHGGLLRFDLSPKPAYHTIRNLIQKTWHTEETLLTDENGTVHFRGFFGDYEVEVTDKDSTVTKKITVAKNADNVFVLQK